VHGFSSIILASARRKRESILSYGELFQRSNRQNLPKRQVQYPMRTSSYTTKYFIIQKNIRVSFKKFKSIQAFLKLLDKHLSAWYNENINSESKGASPFWRKRHFLFSEKSTTERSDDK
jgi:hypothetical protein